MLKCLAYGFLDPLLRRAWESRRESMNPRLNLDEFLNIFSSVWMTLRKLGARKTNVEENT